MNTKYLYIYSIIICLVVGLLRTPLPPSVTFKDDPLRVCVLLTTYSLTSLYTLFSYSLCLSYQKVLRAVRFASRFNFRLHPDIVEAAKSAEIQKALVEKVNYSRLYICYKNVLL